MTIHLRLVMFLAGLLISGSSILAENSPRPALPPSPWSDWPQFLGPERNGTSPEKGLLRQWPAEGPKLLWRVPIPKGFGQPVVSQGEIFLLGGSVMGHALSNKSVVCLEAFTGAKLWEFTYQTRKTGADLEEVKRKSPSWGYCPRATVTISKDQIYSIDQFGEIYCLDRKSGKEIWYRDLDIDYKPSHNDWKGWCASPLLVNNILVLPVTHDWSPPGKHEAKFVGLDARTGKTVWEYSDVIETAQTMCAGSGLYVTPQVAEFAGETCAIMPALTRVLALRIADGEKVWEYPCAKRNWTFSPQVWNNQIYLDKLLTVDRKTPPFATQETASSIPSGAYTYAIPVRSGDYAYTFLYMNDKSIYGKGELSDTRLSCIDLKTGQEVWGKTNLTHGVSLMIADGLIFARTQADLLLLEATPREYVEKGVVHLRGAAGVKGWDLSGFTMPVLAYGRLYIRTEKELLCFQVAEKIPAGLTATLR